MFAPHSFWSFFCQVFASARDYNSFSGTQASLFGGVVGGAVLVGETDGQEIARPEYATVTFDDFRFRVSDIDDGKFYINGLFSQLLFSLGSWDRNNNDITNPQFWPLGKQQGSIRNLGLPSDLPPLLVRINCIDSGNDEDEELCNDGKSLIAGHWGFGIILCAIGFLCSCRAYGWPNHMDLSYEMPVSHSLMWQGLFALFFGFGFYMILSVSFPNCDETPNAAGHRERPDRILSESAELQRGRDAVARSVSPQGFEQGAMLLLSFFLS
jgi:hypothetical protein